MQITGGSPSIRATGQYGVRIAGAAVREMLKRAAAKTCAVSAEEIRTAKSTLYHDGSGRSAPYADFAAAAAQETPSSTPQLKKMSEYSVMGQRRGGSARRRCGAYSMAPYGTFNCRIHR